MFKLNRKAEYALIALRHMYGKNPGELTTVKEICEFHQVPFDVTSRALQKLAGAGVLKSEKGAYGGYKIERDLGRMNLLELIETVLEPVSVADCLDPEKGCDGQARCIIADPVRQLNERLRLFLMQVSVREILTAQLSPSAAVPAAILQPTRITVAVPAASCGECPSMGVKTAGSCHR